MNDLDKTQDFRNFQNRRMTAADILKEVYMALEEKNYDPVNQIVGYIMSGDPTYITSYRGARLLISRIERDELLEEVMKTYFNQVMKNR